MWTPWNSDLPILVSVGASTASWSLHLGGSWSNQDSRRDYSETSFWLVAGSSSSARCDRQSCRKSAFLWSCWLAWSHGGLIHLHFFSALGFRAAVVTWPVVLLTLACEQWCPVRFWWLHVCWKSCLHWRTYSEGAFSKSMAQVSLSVSQMWLVSLFSTSWGAFSYVDARIA